MSSPKMQTAGSSTCPAEPIDPVADVASLPIEEIRLRIGVVQRSLRVLTGKWKWEILILLIPGPVRFNELRRGIPGITQHMLAAQLKDMEAAGLVLRRAYREMPPRVEYELTDAARALKPVAEALFAWGERHNVEGIAAGRADTVVGNRRDPMPLAAAS